MTYKELGEFYFRKIVEYSFKDGWSHELSEFGAMSDTVDYLMKHSKNKDREKATEIVWDFCHNKFNDLLKGKKDE
jgi:hypothetical protein